MEIKIKWIPRKQMTHENTYRDDIYWQCSIRKKKNGFMINVLLVTLDYCNTFLSENVNFIHRGKKYKYGNLVGILISTRLQKGGYFGNSNGNC